MHSNAVLIVSASTGTGHARAAEALRGALADRDPGLRVEHVDLLELAPRWVRAAYGSGFELMVARAPWLWERIYRRTDGDDRDRARWGPLAQRLLFREFSRLLLASPWRLCLCTHFLPCQLAAGRPGLPPFALSVTDFTLHRCWVQPGVRRYFVATDALAAELRPRVRGARVDATGIPIAGSFAAAPPREEARRALGLDAGRRTVLVMGGGLGLGVEEMATATLASGVRDLQVVAVCGRSADARERLEALGLPPERLRVCGYVDGVERYLAAADVVVTKPGGLTSSEALALGRPLLLTRPIPGQEVGNTRALTAAGAALAAPDGRALRGAVEEAFGAPGLLAGLADAARRIGRPAAAADVAEAVRAEYLRETEAA
ncbi:MAG TPA: glycosyltransferase [Longimicrobiaceae bacterium]|jgi:processive 1,2-diacylglycerol beta-glucosyltransferase